MSSLQAQVYIEDDFKVVLKNSTDLSISGNFTNDGIMVGSGNLKLSGNNAQTISGTGVIENFSIDKSGNEAEIVSGHQDVFRIFEIHGGTFKPETRLTLKSNDTLTAQIGQNTGGTILGDMVIERFIPQSNRAFRYFSSPVSTSESIKTNLQEGQNNTGTNYPDDNSNTVPGFGTHITGSKSGSNGFDATETGNSSFFKWNAETQLWNSITNTNVNSLQKGESFALLIRGSRATDLNSNSAVGPETTLRLTGNPTILDYFKTVTLDSNNSFILIGNPYHASIDANKIMQNNSGLNSNFIYVYDPSLNTRGGYATVELKEGGINQQGSAANQFIQGWQSVFVQATNSSPTSLNIAFNETYKAIDEPQVEAFSVDSRINLKLQKDKETIDAISLKLKSNANSDIDQNDAKKLFNYDESISIYSDDQYLSIEERSFPKMIDTVLINLYNKRQDHYQLNIESQHLSQVDIIFKDFYLDEEYPLRSNKDLIIDYEIAEGEPDFRYGFILKPETLSSNEFTSERFQIYPNPTSGMLNIKALEPIDKSIHYEIYSLLSKKVAEGDFSNQNQTLSYDASSLPSGVYLIMISNDRIKETLKFVKH
jgi:hypothetical protein